MGKKKTAESQSTNAPAYAPQVEPVVSMLSSLLGSQGTEQSPYYSDLQRMFSNTMQAENFQLPDYVNKTLESAATTGLPSNTPLEQTQFYKAVAPTFQTAIEDILAGTKESFGAQGALRTGAYKEAAGRGVTKGLGDLILNAAQQAYGLEEAAKGRQLQGTEQAIGAAGVPYTTAAQAGAAATGISAAEYPLIAAMLGLIQTGAGQAGQSTGAQYTYGQQEAGKSYGSTMGSCCWTFIEGEGEITQSVRKYRDKHFGKWSDVGLGYRWLSKKLVPLMRRSKILKQLIRLILTRPLSKYAEWDVGDNDYGFIFKPLVMFWVAIWDRIGKIISDEDLIFTVR